MKCKYQIMENTNGALYLVIPEYDSIKGETRSALARVYLVNEEQQLNEFINQNTTKVGNILTSSDSGVQPRQILRLIQGDK